jgi:hypothetical protein
MKKSTVLLAILIFVGITANAQWELSGLSNDTINAFCINGTNVFTGTESRGIFLSTDNGTNWSPRNVGLSDGDLLVMALSSDGTYIYAGTASSGYLKSPNNGSTWIHMDIYINGSFIYNGVSALAISGTNFYMGTDGYGLCYSNNSGTTWHLANFAGGYISSIVISGTKIFAAGWNYGVFMSTNNGTSWTAVNNGLNDKKVYSLAIQGPYLFAGTTSGLFVTTLNASSWTSSTIGLTSNYVFSFAVRGSNLFAGTSDGVFLSTNSGTNWTSVSNGLSDLVIWSLGASSNMLYAGTYGSGVWKRSFSNILGEKKLINNTLTIFPNPANDRITITRDNNDPLSLSIYDNKGSLVKTAEIEQDQNQVNIADLDNGVYILKFRSGQFVVPKKLIVER